MKSVTTTLLWLIPVGLAVSLLLSCKPDPEPEPSYCEFTFKGLSYRIPNATYYSNPSLFGISLSPYAIAESSVGGNDKAPRLILFTESQEIFFGRDTVDINTVQRGYNSIGVFFRNSSSVSRKGNRFDFSGLLFHEEFLADTVVVTDGDQIEGHCVCRVE